MGFMNSTLEPLIESGSKCIDPENVTAGPSDGDYTWKIVMLCAIFFGYAYKMVGVIHSRIILTDVKGNRERYTKMDQRIKDVYKEEVLEETRSYKAGINTYDILFPTMWFLIEFTMILFDVPALLWYGWLTVFEKSGLCEGDNSYSIWMQPQLGLLLFLSYYVGEALALTPLRYFEMNFKRQNGLSNATCCGFVTQQLVRFLMLSLLNEIPALYISSLLLTAVKKYFFLAIFGGTIFAMVFLIYVMPSLSCFQATYEDLPEEHADLKTRILAVFKRVNYTNERVQLKKSKDGNLHSNASVNSDAVILGSRLLVHHKDNPEEIVAIAAHELGHWQYNHVGKMSVINAAYMLVIGVLIIPLIDNSKFLAAFNIRMQSYVLTLWLIYFLFKNSVHLILKLPIRFYEHYREHQADDYSVDLGFGSQLYMGMVRNFAENKSYLFSSELHQFLNSTHPSFLSRLERIEKRTLEHAKKTDQKQDDSEDQSLVDDAV